MTTALLLIDLQEEFLARPGLVPPRDALIASVAAALSDARAAGEPVFHIRTDGAPMPHRDHRPDATPPPELIEQAHEPVFTKRFFSAFDAPGLNAALHEAGITTLRLAGLHTHACIHATALDAYARGYEVEIDPALIATDAPAHAAQSLAWLGTRAATIIPLAATPPHPRTADTHRDDERRHDDESGPTNERRPIDGSSSSDDSRPAYESGPSKGHRPTNEMDGGPSNERRPSNERLPAEDHRPTNETDAVNESGPTNERRLNDAGRHTNERLPNNGKHAANNSRPVNERVPTNEDRPSPIVHTIVTNSPAEHLASTGEVALPSVDRGSAAILASTGEVALPSVDRGSAAILASTGEVALPSVDRGSAAILANQPQIWSHRDPCDQTRILAQITPTPIDTIVHTLVHTIGKGAGLSMAERGEHLIAWHVALTAARAHYVQALVDTVAKPVADAEAEVTYGLALLSHCIATLSTDDPYDARNATYRPVGRVGLITPWNNPFAIPLGKLAPAIAFGNTILWKPALPGTKLARLLMESLEQVGLAGPVTLLTGGAATGRAMIEHGALDLLSFTGSVPVGRAIIAAAGTRALPVQAELGGCNAAIVDPSADLDFAAADLAAAMFSFSGQRCTAIRRVIVTADIAPAFAERLTAQVAALRLGHPGDPATRIGPVIDRAAQQRFLKLAGTSAPADQPEAGCWVAPTLLHDLPDNHPLLTDEVFGPVAAIQIARDLTHAIALHNATNFGLLGALYSDDSESEARFVAEAQAGMLSINRARPPFSAAGPFVGWKSSGFGPPEHGRWNRETYARPQAIYRD